MAIVYDRHRWKNRISKLNEDNMENIENGLFNLYENASIVQIDIEEIKNNAIGFMNINKNIINFLSYPEGISKAVITIPEKGYLDGKRLYDCYISAGGKLNYDEWINSLKGETGPKGPQGDQGIQGIQGEKGKIGPKGDPGYIGRKGEDGDIGETGPKGPQGDRGIQGIQGEKGKIGPKGEDGDIGETGPKGPKGDQGIQGIQGEKGKIGIKGPKGDDYKLSKEYLDLINLFINNKFSYEEKEELFELVKKIIIDNRISSSEKEFIFKSLKERLDSDFVNTKRKITESKIENLSGKLIDSDRTIGEKIFLKELYGDETIYESDNYLIYNDNKNEYNFEYFTNLKSDKTYIKTITNFSTDPVVMDDSINKNAVLSAIIDIKNIKEIKKDNFVKISLPIDIESNDYLETLISLNSLDDVKKTIKSIKNLGAFGITITSNPNIEIKGIECDAIVIRNIKLEMFSEDVPETYIPLFNNSSKNNLFKNDYSIKTHMTNNFFDKENIINGKIYPNFKGNQIDMDPFKVTSIINGEIYKMYDKQLMSFIDDENNIINNGSFIDDSSWNGDLNILNISNTNYQRLNISGIEQDLSTEIKKDSSYEFGFNIINMDDSNFQICNIVINDKVFLTISNDSILNGKIKININTDSNYKNMKVKFLKTSTECLISNIYLKKVFNFNESQNFTLSLLDKMKLSDLNKDQFNLGTFYNHIFGLNMDTSKEECFINIKGKFKSNLDGKLLFSFSLKEYHLNPLINYGFKIIITDGFSDKEFISLEKMFKVYNWNKYEIVLDGLDPNKEYNNLSLVFLNKDITLENKTFLLMIQELVLKNDISDKNNTQISDENDYITTFYSIKCESNKLYGISLYNSNKEVKELECTIYFINNKGKFLFKDEVNANNGKRSFLKPNLIKEDCRMIFSIKMKEDDIPIIYLGVDEPPLLDNLNGSNKQLKDETKFSLPFKLKKERQNKNLLKNSAMINSGCMSNGIFIDDKNFIDFNLTIANKLKGTNIVSNKNLKNLLKDQPKLKNKQNIKDFYCKNNLIYYSGGNFLDSNWKCNEGIIPRCTDYRIDSGDLGVSFFKSSITTITKNTLNKNILLNSRNPKTNIGYENAQISDINDSFINTGRKERLFYIDPTSNNIILDDIDISLLKSNSYNFSLDSFMEENSGIFIVNITFFPSGKKESLIINNKNIWNRTNKTIIKNEGDTSIHVELSLINSGSDKNRCYFTSLKLEEGTISTNWCWNPEDTIDEIIFSDNSGDYYESLCTGIKIEDTENRIQLSNNGFIKKYNMLGKKLILNFDGKIPIGKKVILTLYSLNGFKLVSNEAVGSSLWKNYSVELLIPNDLNQELQDYSLIYLESDCDLNENYFIKNMILVDSLNKKCLDRRNFLNNIDETNYIGNNISIINPHGKNYFTNDNYIICNGTSVIRTNLNGLLKSGKDYLFECNISKTSSNDIKLVLDIGKKQSLVVFSLNDLFLNKQNRLSAKININEIQNDDNLKIYFIGDNLENNEISISDISIKEKLQINYFSYKINDIRLKDESVSNSKVRDKLDINSENSKRGFTLKTKNYSSESTIILKNAFPKNGLFTVEFDLASNLKGNNYKLALNTNNSGLPPKYEDIPFIEENENNKISRYIHKSLTFNIDDNNRDLTINCSIDGELYFANFKISEGDVNNSTFTYCILDKSMIIEYFINYYDILYGKNGILSLNSVNTKIENFNEISSIIKEYYNLVNKTNKYLYDINLLTYTDILKGEKRSNDINLLLEEIINSNCVINVNNKKSLSDIIEEEILYIKKIANILLFSNIVNNHSRVRGDIIENINLEDYVSTISNFPIFIEPCDLILEIIANSNTINEDIDIFPSFLLEDIEGNVINQNIIKEDNNWTFSKNLLAYSNFIDLKMKKENIIKGKISLFIKRIESGSVLNIESFNLYSPTPLSEDNIENNNIFCRKYGDQEIKVKSEPIKINVYSNICISFDYYDHVITDNKNNKLSNLRIIIKGYDEMNHLVAEFNNDLIFEGTNKWRRFKKELMSMGNSRYLVFEIATIDNCDTFISKIKIEESLSCSDWSTNYLYDGVYFESQNLKKDKLFYDPKLDQYCIEKNIDNNYSVLPQPEIIKLEIPKIFVNSYTDRTIIENNNNCKMEVETYLKPLLTKSERLKEEISTLKIEQENRDVQIKDLYKLVDDLMINKKMK